MSGGGQPLDSRPRAGWRRQEAPSHHGFRQFPLHPHPRKAGTHLRPASRMTVSGFGIPWHQAAHSGWSRAVVGVQPARRPVELAAGFPHRTGGTNRACRVCWERKLYRQALATAVRQAAAGGRGRGCAAGRFGVAQDAADGSCVPQQADDELRAGASRAWPSLCRQRHRSVRTRVSEREGVLRSTIACCRKRQACRDGAWFLACRPPREAKANAAKHHRMARHGLNPVRARGEIPTVAEAVEEFFKEFGPSWVGRNTEHAYRASLAKYVMSRLGARRVDQVRRSDLAAAVKPAWNASATA